MNVNYKNAMINSLRTKEESEGSFKDVSIAITSAVTSYARIAINKAKLDIIKHGGFIYYSDTDSIVTNKPLNKDLVCKNIGQFELNYNTRRAYL